MKQIRLSPFGPRIWLLYKQTEIETFEDWWRKDDGETIVDWNAVDASQDGEFRQEVLRVPASAEAVLSIVGLPIRAQGILSAQLSVDLYTELSAEAYVELSAEAYARPHRFGRIKVIGDGEETLTLRNAEIWKLEVHSVSKLDIENCKIGEIAVHQTADYDIRRSMIGNFVVVKEKEKARKKDKDERGFHIQDISWRGGYLGQFDLHQDKVRAFVGNASFDWITLPRTRERHGVQWLRDAREALTARNNLVAASVFHASELKLARPKGWRRFLFPYWWASWAYQVGSNFGRSIGLPFSWLALIYASLVWLALEIGTAASDSPLGWQSELEGVHPKAQRLRALVYAAQAIFNPFNIIVQKPLVAIAHPEGAFGGFALGALGTIAFTFLLLSLRRRFKLE